jgi:hypothetical protein
LIIGERSEDRMYYPKLDDELIKHTVEAFEEYKHLISPDNSFRGYFAKRRKNGVIGASALAALAIKADVVTFKYGLSYAMEWAARWGDKLFGNLYGQHYWVRYGISDGWRGDALNLYEPQMDYRGGVGGRCDTDYQNGYSWGREAAIKLGLSVPKDIVIVRTEEEYGAYLKSTEKAVA